MQDSTAMKHSMFINKASMLTRMKGAQNITIRVEDLFKATV